MEGVKQQLEVPLPFPDKPVGFWVGQFYRSDGGLRRDRRQFWSYGVNGTWTADDNSRFNFARYPALYKIYIMRPLGRKDEKLEADPTLDFIKVFMPELQKRLFGSRAEKVRTEKVSEMLCRVPGSQALFGNQFLTPWEPVPDTFSAQPTGFVGYL